MPSPTRSSFHINTPLSDLAIGYMQDQKEYISEQIFPSVPVDKQSDYYYIFAKGPWLRNAVQRRAPGDEYPEGRFTVSSTTYNCDLYHLGYAIPDEDAVNADAVIQLEQSGAEWLAQQFLLNREIVLASEIFVTSVWGTTVTGGVNFVQWDDYDDSNPITDVNTAKQTIQKSTGKRANTLVIGQEVFDILAEHPLLLEKFKYTTAGILEEDEVRRALKVDKLVVGGSVYDSAQEGGSASGGYIWGKNALLMHVPAAPGIRVAAAGYTFVWQGDWGGGDTVAISSTRQDWRDRDLLKGKYAFDNKITATDLGYMMLTATG